MIAVDRSVLTAGGFRKSGRESPPKISDERDSRDEYASMRRRESARKFVEPLLIEISLSFSRWIIESIESKRAPEKLLKINSRAPSVEFRRIDSHGAS